MAEFVSPWVYVWRGNLTQLVCDAFVLGFVSQICVRDTQQCPELSMRFHLKMLFEENEQLTSDKLKIFGLQFTST